MPGEFLQIDWGEMRDMPFTKEDMSGQTRYFFAARLKYSRYMFVSFQPDMREETLLRCLIACFTTAVGGGDRQYEDGGAGTRRAAPADLEPGLPETGGGVQVSPRCVCAGFRQPERGR